MDENPNLTLHIVNFRMPFSPAYLSNYLIISQIVANSGKKTQSTHTVLHAFRGNQHITPAISEGREQRA